MFAFPTPEYFDEKIIGVIPGMMLRDYFAAHALVLFTDPGILVAIREEARARNISESVLFARAVYDVADAMLTQRDKKE